MSGHEDGKDVVILKKEDYYTMKIIYKDEKIIVKKEQEDGSFEEVYRGPGGPGCDPGEGC